MERLFLDRKEVTKKLMTLPISLRWDDEVRKWMAKKITPWVEPKASSHGDDVPPTAVAGYQTGSFSGARMPKHEIEDERQENTLRRKAGGAQKEMEETKEA